MKGKIVVLVAAALAAAAIASFAAATPPTGIVAAPTLARGTLGGDVMFVSKPADATGLTDWRGRAWTPNQLPEFLKMLRDGGVSDLGAWISAHPAAAAKMGVPVARKVVGADFVVQQVTIAPGGSTGWHTHPGPAVVLVKSGDFTLYEGSAASCQGTVYKTGQSFIDQGFGNVHIGRNEGTANVELYVFYLAPAPAGQPVRIDATKPAASTCAF